MQPPAFEKEVLSIIGPLIRRTKRWWNSSQVSSRPWSLRSRHDDQLVYTVYIGCTICESGSGSRVAVPFALILTNTHASPTYRINGIAKARRGHRRCLLLVSLANRLQWRLLSRNNDRERREGRQTGYPRLFAFPSPRFFVDTGLSNSSHSHLKQVADACFFERRNPGNEGSALFAGKTRTDDWTRSEKVTGCPGGTLLRSPTKREQH